MSEVPTGLALLRAPFPPNQISKLPKETKNQIEARKANGNLMVWKCQECGGHHHKDADHLDYVGHAALTDRLLDCDPQWNWEPVILPGLPNPGNGMWIKLTVCGVSRIGFGDASGKQGGDAIKEVIGDALRNAAMRFGAALDLWHKGDLHAIEAEEAAEVPAKEAQQPAPKRLSQSQWAKIVQLIEATSQDTSKILAYYGVDDLKRMTYNAAIHCINGLEEKLSKIAAKTSLADELNDEIGF